MKRMGVYGLAIPEPYGEVAVSTPCYALVTAELARGLDEPGRRDGRAHRGGHAAARLRHRGTAGSVTCRGMATGEGAGHDGVDRARWRLGFAGHGYQGTKGRGPLRGQRVQDVDQQRAAFEAWWRCLCKTDPDAQPQHKGISILLVEQGTPGYTISKDLPKLGYKGCGELRAELRRRPGTGRRAARRHRGQGVLADDAGPGDRRIAGRVARAGGGRVPPSMTRCATHRSGRASVSRSGSTSRWATTSPTWPPRSPPPSS